MGCNSTNVYFLLTGVCPGPSSPSPRTTPPHSSSCFQPRLFPLHGGLQLPQGRQARRMTEDVAQGTANSAFTHMPLVITLSCGPDSRAETVGNELSCVPKSKERSETKWTRNVVFVTIHICFNIKKLFSPQASCKTAAPRKWPLLSYDSTKHTPPLLPITHTIIGIHESLSLWLQVHLPHLSQLISHVPVLAHKPHLDRTAHKTHHGYLLIPQSVGYTCPHQYMACPSQLVQQCLGIQGPPVNTKIQEC